MHYQQSTKSSILGSGKESGLITALILPLSVQNILVESDLGTKIHGERHRLIRHGKTSFTISHFFLDLHGKDVA